MQNKVAVFILTHGRPDKVVTIDTLRKQGYTGEIYLVVDNEDSKQGEYLEKFGDKCIIFDKMEAAKITDVGDNTGTRKGVVFARNYVFKIAEDLGYRYFIVLDDDYGLFQYKVNYHTGHIFYKGIKNLDRIFDNLVDYFKSSDLDCLAIGQGGDYIGGGLRILKHKVKRKLMNFFICDTQKPFKFMGRTNEDTTCYTHLGAMGKKFLSIMSLSLIQKETQQSSGGLTELYLETGTYVKSFFSVMYQPSSVCVSIMKSKHPRLHHLINWNKTVPKIIREELKKK